MDVDSSCEQRHCYLPDYPPLLELSKLMFSDEWKLPSCRVAEKQIADFIVTKWVPGRTLAAL